MKKITNKDRKPPRVKLTLQRDTLAHLTGDQLRKVVGGAPSGSDGSDNSACSGCSSTFI
jgi:hypothetical protein